MAKQNNSSKKPQKYQKMLVNGGNLYGSENGLDLYKDGGPIQPYTYSYNQGPDIPVLGLGANVNSKSGLYGGASVDIPFNRQGELSSSQNIGFNKQFKNLNTDVNLNNYSYSGSLLNPSLTTNLNYGLPINDNANINLGLQNVSQKNSLINPYLTAGLKLYFKTGGTMATQKYGSNIYALGGGAPSIGGPLQNAPLDFTQQPHQGDQLTEFNQGGSHEENPNGGIPQGMNPNGQQNLVEEGETKLNSKNYIFSDSLKVDKKIAEDFYLPSKFIGKTFAEVSKAMNRPNSRREYDSIEETAKKKDLDYLMAAQEEFKQKQLEKDMEKMMVKHPEFMQQMLTSQQPPQAPQAPVDQFSNSEQPQAMPGEAPIENPMSGIPPQSPMAKLGGYQNQLGFGGFIKNYGLGLADSALSMFGASNVIKDNAYSGTGSNFAKKAANIAGTVGKIGLQVGANVLAPGVGGAIVGAGQTAIANADTDSTGKKYDSNGQPLKLGGYLYGNENAGLMSSYKTGGYMNSNGYDETAGIQFKPGGYMVTDPLNAVTNTSGIKRKKAEEDIKERDHKLNDVVMPDIKQSGINALGTYAPVAYNLGMGLFSKAEHLDANDYIHNANISNWKNNINPQLKASDEAYASANYGLRNSGAGSAAYLSNLQALHNSQEMAKAGIYANAETDYNNRQFQIDQYNAARGDAAAQKRLEIAQFNMQSDAAKENYTQTGLKQLGDISAADTQNQLGLAYAKMMSPDVSKGFNYTSYLQRMAEKMIGKNKTDKE